MKSVKYLKRVFLITWLVFAMIGIGFGIKAYINGDFGFDRNLDISNFHICTSSSDLTTNVTSLSIKDIKDKSVQLYACGVIHSNKAEDLNIYVIQEPGNKIVFQNKTSNFYPPGELFFHIDTNRINSVGEYKVEVYFYRDIVGTANFSISE